MMQVTPGALAFVVPQHTTMKRDVSLLYTTNDKNVSLDAKYIRLVPRTVRGSRQCFDLQTAVTLFQRITPQGETQQVDLHAQLHFGDKDYFEYYSSGEFEERYDGVLYELVIDDSMLKQDVNGNRYLSQDGTGIMASPTDQQTASQYGLTCQVMSWIMRALSGFMPI
jgi:hypothetical protein